jgi:transcriptional regulator with XRE-family HTH domain
MAKRVDIAELGRRVAAMRHQHDLTQQELATAAGLQQTAVARLERGRQAAVRADTVLCLAEALNVSTDYLLAVTDDPTPRAQPRRKRQAKPDAVAEEAACCRECGMGDGHHRIDCSVGVREAQAAVERARVITAKLRAFARPAVPHG